jgi:hypothetical protein
MIATFAAGNQIIPRGLPSARAWQHMIEGQFRGRVLSSAILASGMVAQQYILSRERAAFKRDVNVFRKTNHRGGVNREFLGMEHVAVVFLDPRHSFKNHDHGAPFGAHVNGLERSIQD